MRIHTVAVMGAGAVGSYLIWGLHEKLGENLRVIAEGERKERLEKEGIIVNGSRIALNVKTPGEAGDVDLLFVTVKYGALKPSLAGIEKIVGENTVVMSLLNGVDSEEIIGARVGREHMIYSLMKIASERQGNAIAFDNEITQGVFFGECGPSDREKVKAIADLFEGTEIHYQICRDIIRDIWFKYALNISKNLPQAMVGCGFGAYTDSESVMAISRKLREEVVAVAGKKGIDIADESNVTGNPVTISPKARFSTLQDLDAKRCTEIEMFSGTLIRMGKELGVATPYNEFTYYMIKALEEKNAGVFDYEK